MVGVVKGGLGLRFSVSQFEDLGSVYEVQG